MESIRGRRSAALDRATLLARVAEYPHVLVDVGTGDGRYARHVARAHPDWFAIGVDTCRENLRATARVAPDNALYLIANGLALPAELAGVATRVTINFPWGSLLTGLLDGRPALLDGLRSIARPGAALEVRLNAGALAEAGWALAEGAARVRQVLRDDGRAVAPLADLDAAALRTFPSTWAKRLAWGRDPRAALLTATAPAGDGRTPRAGNGVVAAGAAVGRGRAPPGGRRASVFLLGAVVGGRGRRLKPRLEVLRTTKPACAGSPSRPNPSKVAHDACRPQPAETGFVAQPPGAGSPAGPDRTHSPWGGRPAG